MLHQGPGDGGRVRPLHPARPDVPGRRARRGRPLLTPPRKALKRVRALLCVEPDTDEEHYLAPDGYTLLLFNQPLRNLSPQELLELSRTEGLWPWQAGDAEEPLGAEDLAADLREFISVVSMGPENLLRIVELVKEISRVARCGICTPDRLVPRCLYCGDLEQRPGPLVHPRVRLVARTTQEIESRYARLLVGARVFNIFRHGRWPANCPYGQRAVFSGDRYKFVTDEADPVLRAWPQLRSLALDAGVYLYEREEDPPCTVVAVWNYLQHA